MKKKELLTKTKKDLLAIAKEKGLTGLSKAIKEDIVDAVAKIFSKEKRDAAKATKKLIAEANATPAHKTPGKTKPSFGGEY